MHSKRPGDGTPQRRTQGHGKGHSTRDSTHCTNSPLHSARILHSRESPVSFTSQAASPLLSSSPRCPVMQTATVRHRPRQCCLVGSSTPPPNPESPMPSLTQATITISGSTLAPILPSALTLRTTLNTVSARHALRHTDQPFFCFSTL